MTIYSTKIGIIQQKLDLFNKFKKEFNKSAFTVAPKTSQLQIYTFLKAQKNLLISG
jgi:hypothetical protein